MGGWGVSRAVMGRGSIGKPEFYLQVDSIEGMFTFCSGSKMTIWYRSWFLFCSFGPLYLLLGVGLAVQADWSVGGLWHYDRIAIVLSGLCFILSISVFLILRAGFTAGSPHRSNIYDLETLDDSILGYMLSYFPPLMIDDLRSASKLMPAVVFYVVLVLILAKTDKMYVNPYFLIFGYRIFRVRLSSGRAVVLITPKSELRVGEVTTLFEIQPSTLFYAP